MEETKVIYYIDDEETPYLMKVPTAPEKVTLGDFKAQLNRVYHKFFFKSMDDDFGVVKEEVADDDALLPSANGRVVCWVVTGESSASGSDVGAPKGDTASVRARGEDEMSIASGMSKASSRSHRHRQHRRHHRGKLPNGHTSDMDSCTDIASATDLDATSFCDTEDTQSRVSASTLTSLQPRKKVLTKTRPKIPRSSSCSTMTSSSVTTDGSMQIINVVLNMDSVSFLGISIVGQTSEDGAGGIYVGTVMKGGAVAADGRIEKGDMLLEVNGISFEKMSNDDAVRTLREIVQQPGTITLTVAKCWGAEPVLPQFEPRMEPIRPIDPSAWVMQANQQGEYSRPFTGSPTLSTMTSVSSPSLVSSMPESDTMQSKLTLTTPMYRIAKALATPTSGLEVKDRIWLKMTIPKSFIGSDLVDWLNINVEGFIDRRHARKYAALMLKHGFIRHTVNKITFSEQCYYVFGDFRAAANSLPAEFSNLHLSDSGDGDTLGPLPSNHWGSSDGEYSAQFEYFSTPSRPTAAASSSSHSSKSNSPSPDNRPPSGHHSPAGSGTSGSSSRHRSASINSNGNNGSSNGIAESQISHMKHSASMSSSSGFSSVSQQIDRHSIHSSRNSALGVPSHLGQSRESFLQALDNPIAEHFIDVM
ncbi:hypothetical protein EMCRGX_G017080 [Ephydatia muelleri]|uniref:Dishevelled n=1 Tax=Ephydatia muelleri TaxID=6052 RepID=A0A0U2GRA3_EPHMU|nr:dishevelled [Ephydatia muelleri]|eukprot:Em0008g347a